MYCPPVPSAATAPVPPAPPGGSAPAHRTAVPAATAHPGTRPWSLRGQEKGRGGGGRGVSASAQDSSTSCDCSPRNASLEPAGQEAINRAQRMRSRAYLFPPPCLYSRIHPPTHPHTCPLCLDDDAVQQVKQLGHDSRRHPLVDEEGVEEALAEQAALQLRGRRRRRRGHKVGGIPLTR